MSKCPECKIRYRDIQNFCHWCGAPLVKNRFLRFGKREDGSYERGIIHYLRGTFYKAQKEFEAILRVNRHDADAYYQLGKIYEQKGEIKKALKLYRSCLKCDKDKKWEVEVSSRIKKLEK